MGKRKQKKPVSFRGKCVSCGIFPVKLVLGLCSKCLSLRRKIGLRRVTHVLALRESGTFLPNLSRGTMLFESLPLGKNEFILGYWRDPAEFISEHFKTLWIDRSKGIHAFYARLHSSPETFVIQSIWFARKHAWDKESIKQWFTVRGGYVNDAGESKLLEALSSGRLFRPKTLLKGWHHSFKRKKE